jgi:hypothetical protein
MFYPCNYGFVPETLADDGDPADVLVITPYPLIHDSVITVRPIGEKMLNLVFKSGIYIINAFNVVIRFTEFLKHRVGLF